MQINEQGKLQSSLYYNPNDDSDSTETEEVEDAQTMRSSPAPQLLGSSAAQLLSSSLRVSQCKTMLNAQPRLAECSTSIGSVQAAEAAARNYKDQDG